MDQDSKTWNTDLAMVQQILAFIMAVTMGEQDQEGKSIPNEI